MMNEIKKTENMIEKAYNSLCEFLATFHPYIPD